MYWPQLSDVASSLVCGLRAHLPWVLLAAGLLIQAAGVGVLVHRVRSTGRMIEPVAEVSLRPPGAMAADQVVGLPEMNAPIADGHVPRDPALLPGARRAYRGGKHEGVDFSCNRGTPVLAAAAGWVLSIDDEPNLPEARRNEVLAYTRALDETPPEVLQVLHGLRIVLCHGIRGGKLLTTSYSHLASVRPELRPGASVQLGEVIGESGSSGTSHAYRDDGWAEVHFEIRLNSEPLGLGLPPKKAGALYRLVLGLEAPRPASARSGPHAPGVQSERNLR